MKYSNNQETIMLDAKTRSIAEKLKLITIKQPTGSRNFPLILKRALKLRNDFDIYFSGMPFDKISKVRGGAQAKIAYSVLKLQCDVIAKNKELHLPSQNTLALAFNCTAKTASRTINKLKKSGLIYLDDPKCSGGRLNKLYNPKRDDEIFRKKSWKIRYSLAQNMTTKSEKAREYIQCFFEKQNTPCKTTFKIELSEQTATAQPTQPDFQIEDYSTNDGWALEL